MFTAATLAAVLAVSATQPTVKLSVSSTTGVYTLAVDDKPWYGIDVQVKIMHLVEMLSAYAPIVC